MKYKILGFAFLIVALAAVISLIYYVEVSNQKPLEPLNHKRLEVRTYTNDLFGFEVKYDRAYALSTAADLENYFRTKGQTLATIAMRYNSYPNTNFGSAQATFAVREGTAAENCIYYVTGANTSSEMTEKISINGKEAFTAEFTGAAAGTKYTTRLYHIPHNNTCYEISLTTGIANIGNYEQGTVMELNEADIWQRLGAVVNTFKFTK
ncbi:MAG: hypothetical protein A3B10_01555 [Candidatus Doudnabacteria bacterium RIFCSPLOWO2_01_FULL_44_21]|uniref:Uncharacterized protein n=1 Tax=Candidatus Doudnabacteria bacterium RIFCSPLOWO2_01_FULL_44_21 TaxID=1817841 RepID=A0A1F5PX19_9BACT|nr:MAG: hypothetical protein A3B95_04460 [Candidatus Doudnabacteria bacterium RIFCSPHIGHO2_02_FULL_43_13b]OGE94468.1 MAG: hypothetical protein A3B10_01555 [Candidatus Doudnabacteria bacterium RIFCSPLOWO2_01_FULL_44_21]